MADSADDIMQAFKAGRVAPLVGIEGGHQIDDSLPVLCQMYALGARYVTLARTLDNDWADSATDAPKHPGVAIAAFGIGARAGELNVLISGAATTSLHFPSWLRCCPAAAAAATSALANSHRRECG